MTVFFYTNKGPTRKINEDGLFINGCVYSDMETGQSLELSDDRGLLAVIDGLGGMGGGREATKITLENLKLENWEATPDVLETERRLVQIPQKLIKRATESPEFAHMGVCIAGIWIGQTKSVIFNCGDCRVYQLRGTFLQKHSHDHSLVQELYDRGEIDEDSMRYHPRKNIVRSALMVDDPDPLIYTLTVPKSPKDIFLVCSDGVWEALSLEEMEAIVVQEPQKAMNDLIKMAFSIPAKDNYSFILVYC